jgi:hypothetical protein
MDEIIITNESSEECILFCHEEDALKRSPRHTIIAIDASGSMLVDVTPNKTRFSTCINLTYMMMDDLSKLTDQLVSIILFSNEATLVINGKPPGEIESLLTKFLMERKDDVKLFLGTNLSGATDTFGKLIKTISGETDIAYLLMTDGAPTIGLCNKHALYMQMRAIILDIKSTSLREPVLAVLGISDEACHSTCRELSAASQNNIFRGISDFEDLAGIMGSLSSVLTRSYYQTCHGNLVYITPGQWNAYVMNVVSTMQNVQRNDIYADLLSFFQRRNVGYRWKTGEIDWLQRLHDTNIPRELRAICTQLIGCAITSKDWYGSLSYAISCPIARASSRTYKKRYRSGVRKI